jgi:hypothetical protein
MVLGAGSIPEEIFGICHRRDCETVKMLRHRALGDVLRSGVSAIPSELLNVTKRTIRSIGYVVEDVHDAVVEEYAKLLSLDIPLNENVATLLGNQPGQTLEELIYQSHDSLVDALHTTIMGLYMEYVDSGDMRRLEVPDFAAYTVLAMLQRGRVTRKNAAKLLSWITDQVLKT